MLFDIFFQEIIGKYKLSYDDYNNISFFKDSSGVSCATRSPLPRTFRDSLNYWTVSIRKRERQIPDLRMLYFGTGFSLKRGSKQKTGMTSRCLTRFCETAQCKTGLSWMRRSFRIQRITLCIEFYSRTKVGKFFSD